MNYSRCSSIVTQSAHHVVTNQLCFRLQKVYCGDLDCSSPHMEQTFVCGHAWGFFNINRRLSWYSDWLRSGRPRGRSSRPGNGKIFLLYTSSRPLLGPTQPPIQWVIGALFSEVKRPRREAGHPPPTSGEVKNTWIYTATSLYVFIA
jgi:hypothetical protein